jgi:aconitate hydratase
VLLLGVRAVIAESFERIHRSNLIGMGVLPLQFLPGTTRQTLQLDGSEQFDLPGQGGQLIPGAEMRLTIRRADGRIDTVPVICRLNTADEVAYYRDGGILHHVLRKLLK